MVHTSPETHLICNWHTSQNKKSALLKTRLISNYLPACVLLQECYSREIKLKATFILRINVIPDYFSFHLQRFSFKPKTKDLKAAVDLLNFNDQELEKLMHGFRGVRILFLFSSLAGETVHKRFFNCARWGKNTIFSLDENSFHHNLVLFVD